jgi:transposase-like protein
MPDCPYCSANNHQVKAGKNPSGSQRILCKVCGRKYTPGPFPNGYSSEFKHRAVLMCLEGQSFRAISRKLKISTQTVVNWINAYVARSARAIYRLPKTGEEKRPSPRD